MRALVYERYGSPDALEVREIDQPELVDDGVLVRVHAASVNPADWHMMTGVPYLARLTSGLRRPKSKQLGVDYAGTVEAVGANVTDFKPGDEVFGGRNGSLAEYVVARADRAIVSKPENVTFEQAGAVAVAALTALQGLRDKGGLEAGQRVLVNGASGGVGTFAVQIAKALGAEVTAVCSSRNVDAARALGADRVIDYRTQEDFTRSGERYDLVLDIAGNRSWSDMKRVLVDGGRLVAIGGPKHNRWIGPFSDVIKKRIASIGDSRRFVFFIAKIDKEGMLAVRDLIADGKVTPVVERTYPLSEAAEAMRYLGQGHAQGKIVVTI